MVLQAKNIYELLLPLSTAQPILHRYSTLSALTPDELINKCTDLKTHINKKQ